ncbi:unnamed protein product, partial [Effrenium voratum]
MGRSGRTGFAYARAVLRLVPACMQRLCRVATWQFELGKDESWWVADFVAKSDFPVYDRRECSRRGVWRTVLARVNPAGDMPGALGEGAELVMVQTTTLSEEDRQRFVTPLVAELTKDMGVTSVFLQFNDEVTDAARASAV